MAEQQHHGSARYDDPEWVIERIVQLADEGTMAIPNSVGHPDMTEAERDALDAAVGFLEERMLVKLDRRMAGMWVAKLGLGARPHVANARRTKTSRPARRKFLRHAYLRWIYDNESVSDLLTADDFLASGVHWFGDPIDEASLQETGAWLLEAGYIRGDVVDQRPDPVRVHTTSKGLQAIEHRIELGAPGPVSSSTSFTNINHGTQAIAQGSGDASQHLSLDWRVAAEAMAVNIAALRESLPNAVRAEFEAQADALREAVRSDEPEGKTKSDGALREVAKAGASGGANGAMNALGLLAASMLGL